MFESNDTFVEDAVKVVETQQDKAKKTAALVMTLMLLFATANFSRGPLTIVMVILLIVLAILTILLFTNKNIEYEYDYTNGSLEIAKIINNSKRKKIVSIESSEIKLIAAIGTNESLKFDHVKLKTFDCSAHNEELKDYILVAHSEAKGYDFKVLFTPSEDLLNAMERYNKRDMYR